MVAELAEPLRAHYLLHHEPEFQMPEVGMKDVQNPWTCRWVRLAFDVVGYPELEQAGDGCVCGRDANALR